MGVHHLHKHQEAASMSAARPPMGKGHTLNTTGAGNPKGAKLVTQMPKVNQVQHYSRRSLKGTDAPSPHAFGGVRAGAKGGRGIVGKTINGANMGRPTSGGQLN